MEGEDRGFCCPAAAAAVALSRDSKDVLERPTAPPATPTTLPSTAEAAEVDGAAAAAATAEAGATAAQTKAYQHQQHAQHDAQQAHACNNGRSAGGPTASSSGRGCQPDQREQQQQQQQRQDQQQQEEEERKQQQQQQQQQQQRRHEEGDCGCGLLGWRPYTGAPFAGGVVEERRSAAALGVVQQLAQRDPVLLSVCNVIARLFECPAAFLGIIDHEWAHFKATAGADVQRNDRRWAVCTWALVPLRPEPLVVCDLSADGRFQRHPFVTGPPHMRFYGGVPLVSSLDVRLGTLCVVDYRARAFPAECVNVLANLGEVVVQEIEDRVPPAEGQARVHRLSQRRYRPALLLDLRSPKWKVLFKTRAWPDELRAAGEEEDKGDGAGDGSGDFWGVFAPFGSDAGQGAHNPGARYATKVKSGRPFHVMVAPRSAPGQAMLIDFRPANTSRVWDDAVRIPLVHSSTAGGAGAAPPPNVAGLYTAVLLTHDAGGAAACSSGGSGSDGLIAAGMSVGMLRQLLPPPGLLPLPTAGAELAAAAAAATPTRCTPFVGVSLGPMCGRGSFGHVFMGVRDGGLPPVAIKVIPFSSGCASVAEAQLGLKLRHPNIVRTLAYAEIADGSRPIRGALRSSGSVLCSSSNGGGSGACGGVGSGVKRARSPSPPRRASSPGDDAPMLPLEAAAASPTGRRSAASMHSGGSGVTWPLRDRPGSAAGAAAPGTATPGAVAATPGAVAAVGPAASGRLWRSATVETGGGALWILLEYCDGGTLQQAIDSGAFRSGSGDIFSGGVDIRRVLDAAAAVASGMEHLHLQGIMHRDLNPKNIMLSGGVPKICDFGLAHAHPADATAASGPSSHHGDHHHHHQSHDDGDGNGNGAAALGGACHQGTVTHLPPEVLLGTAPFDARAEVYAMGVLLYELYTSSRPFAGLGPAQVATRKMLGRGGLTLPPHAPAGYRQLAERCMHPDPQQRPPFAEVRTELQRLRGLLPPPSPSSSSQQQQQQQHQGSLPTELSAGPGPAAAAAAAMDTGAMGASAAAAAAGHGVAAAAAAGTGPAACGASPTVIPATVEFAAYPETLPLQQQAAAVGRQSAASTAAAAAAAASPAEGSQGTGMQC